MLQVTGLHQLQTVLYDFFPSLFCFSQLLHLLSASWLMPSSTPFLPTCWFNLECAAHSCGIIDEIVKNKERLILVLCNWYTLGSWYVSFKNKLPKILFFNKHPHFFLSICLMFKILQTALFLEILIYWFKNSVEISVGL